MASEGPTPEDFLQPGEVPETLANMRRTWAHLLPLAVVDTNEDGLQRVILAAFPGAVFAPAEWTSEVVEVPPEDVYYFRGKLRPVFIVEEHKTLAITWGAWAWQVSLDAVYTLPREPGSPIFKGSSAAGKVLRQPGVGGAGMRLPEWRPAMRIKRLASASAAEMEAFCAAMKYQGAQF